ncbi:hypothetical protein [Salinibacter phage M31CR41-2]|uniref:Uncharacterized protein n=1 Tax=Salinibacter phage M31CR41-2 TaxID=2681614 RepID=A0A2I6UH14_9CAUD|nr:hypothetical protein FGG68_gp06 [Salinibacter phage M31CR41-2]AUO79279.1 hypothetical protein [Salinibacter phage M31CR41-2]AUO79349.1 hypothetical protein [Salinibacter virus M31CR41-3]
MSTQMMDLNRNEMMQPVQAMMKFFALASERANELAENHGVPEDKVRDVLFLPSRIFASFPQTNVLYEAHLDEMTDRIKGLMPPLFSEENREHLLDPTRAEVLATCLIEFDPDAAFEGDGPDTFDTFTVWLIYDVLDGYLENAELFEQDPEDLFVDWEGEESEESLRQLEDRLVIDHPREFFIDGRVFDLPSDRPVSEVSPEVMVRH